MMNLPSSYPPPTTIALLPRPPHATQCKKILTLIGTRPEAIKLAPVIRQIESEATLQAVNVISAQHTSLLRPFIDSLGVRVHHRLTTSRRAPSLNATCARIIAALDDLLLTEQPDLVIVQGDTTTALAGALAGFNRQIKVAHVEAGLRSHDTANPFPEEANRTLITRLATYHFAATRGNQNHLLTEGVRAENIFVTGNTVIDSLHEILLHHEASPALRSLLARTQGTRRIILTTHRRESFGEVLRENLEVLRRFVGNHDDVSLIFPVHPNPSVVEAAHAVLSDADRVHLIAPLDYADFITLLESSWLIVSDSGGVQEEAPTLKRPLLILRETTERPEAIEAGVARLVGGSPARLRLMLDEANRKDSWVERLSGIENPFGRGDSSQRIVAHLVELLDTKQAQRRVG